MQFTIGSTKVIFDMPIGVYTAWPESAAGKTYTATLLKSLAALGDTSVLVLTFESVQYLSEQDIINMINRQSYKVIFVDRADRYVTRKICEALSESNAIVYMDCKNNNKDIFICGEDCEIEFSEDIIRYYVDTI